jgi:hypothetical protein
MNPLDHLHKLLLGANGGNPFHGKINLLRTSLKVKFAGDPDPFFQSRENILLQAVADLVSLRGETHLPRRVIGNEDKAGRHRVVMPKEVEEIIADAGEKHRGETGGCVDPLDPES